MIKETRSWVQRLNKAGHELYVESDVKTDLPLEVADCVLWH